MSDYHILDRTIGPGFPVYVIAELSANHNQDFEQAVRLVRAAKEAGADAVKLQTYTPDTITIRSDRPEFRVIGGTIWDGRTLYDLYGEAYTPWDWQPKLKQLADDIGIHLFSTPFDSTAVDFLEAMNVPAYKIASFELVDLPLVRKIAQTGKPIIMSTGMATLAEIDEAVQAIREAGGRELALLKCTSGYPALPEEMNLRTIPHLAEAFGVPVGLSDHTLDNASAVAAVALGACIVEKHFTLSRAVQGPDSAFSLEPAEFRAMVDAIHTAEKALGRVHYGVNPREAASRAFRRSLYVVKDVKAGEVFTNENVRSIRPANGLPPKHLAEILGRRAGRAIPAGTPLSWELLG
ncbi:MAG: pseudaminic acid synthase [Dissulfurispiraceae bacterium]|jgi:N-acetylneuraminate synthase